MKDHNSLHPSLPSKSFPTPDFRILFESSPELYLVLNPDPKFTIVAASNAYLKATMTKRSEILGRGLFEIFPDNPNDPTANGVQNLRLSLEKVRKDHIADTMGVQKYDIRRPLSEGGQFELRYWNPVNSPVFGPTNELTYIIHCVEDVTDIINHNQQELNKKDALANQLKVRTEQMENEIHLHAQELQAANKCLLEVQRELEIRVEQRTAELLKANTFLTEQVAKLKQAEDRIREQAALLDKTQDAILVLDLNNQIIFWNKSAERIYGWQPSEIIEKNGDILFSKKQISKFKDIPHLVDETGEWIGQLNHIDKEGREIIVESRWVLVKDELGQPQSYLIANTDITEKQKLAEQFLRAQRMESIGALAGGIAHDLNNILSPILMGMHLVSNKITDEKILRIVKVLEESAQRGVEMVKQVLSFARGVEEARAIIQLKSLITDIKKMFSETFPKDIEIEAILDKDLWAISGDATQIYQVLMNICVNARDALPKGGKIIIKAENIMIDEHYALMNSEAKPGQFVLITIEDNGTGIPAEVIHKIFEPFFTTKELGKGTGVGLSSALAIVKNHGGFINVYSEIGKGTRFKIYLPIVIVNEPHILMEAQAKMLRGQGELILVVDDEVSIRQITQVTLEAYGYEVITANDGTEAVAIYARNLGRVKLVLMDMMMPNLDGHATTKILKKLDAQVKIVCTSGFVATGKPIEELGVNSFLTKPYTAMRLLETISEVLNH